MTSSTNHLPDWRRIDDFLNAFSSLKTQLAPSWTAAENLQKAVRTWYEAEIPAIKAKLQESREKMKPYGGDPVDSDLRAFRPLRTSREEDWSDWFAWFIQTSEHGFLRETLNIDLNSKVNVERETNVGDYRTDLLIFYNDTIVHIEVKLWDNALSKTFETANQIKSRYEKQGRHKHFVSFILMTKELDGDWKSEGSDHSVSQIFWNDVAVEFRKHLLKGGENLRWNCLAHLFTGAIEQRILGYCHLNDSTIEHWENLFWISDFYQLISEALR